MKKSIKILLIVLAVIAVVIVSVGILFYMGIIGTGAVIHNDAQDLVESQMDVMGELAMSAFNEQSIIYCGDDVRGGNVKGLINRVKRSNETSEDKIKLEGITTIEEVEVSAKYTVKESCDKNGTINKITITEN